MNIKKILLIAFGMAFLGSSSAMMMSHVFFDTKKTSQGNTCEYLLLQTNESQAALDSNSTLADQQRKRLKNLIDESIKVGQEGGEDACFFQAQKLFVRFSENNLGLKVN